MSDEPGRMNRTEDSTFYEIEHITRFRYSAPVREEVVTLYLQPTSDASQHLESFRLGTEPGAELSDFEDCFGNTAHFFDIPSEHEDLTVAARSLVGLHLADPPDAPGPGWDDLSALGTSRRWHLLHPTPLTRPTPALGDFVKKCGIERGDTPLASIRELTTRIHGGLAFERGATGVDSPIDHALEGGRGVCQDFSHIMLAIVRGWGIPARYTSGYLFASGEDDERLTANASHAWVECLLPGLGWVGADPTNDTVPPRRHIRVAVGRDYRDVPPTRGTFRGAAEQQLEVTVGIAIADAERNGRGLAGGLAERARRRSPPDARFSARRVR